jgi:hypothetical protein
MLDFALLKTQYKIKIFHEFQYRNSGRSALFKGLSRVLGQPQTRETIGADGGGNQ